MIASVTDLNPGDVFRHESGRLYRLVGYWTQPVVILDPVEPDEDGCETREYMAVGSEMARPFTRLVPEVTG